MYYCPYCGESAPHGDERHVWMGWHIDGRLHRLWWRRKKKRIQFLEQQLQRIINMEKGSHANDASDLIIVIQSIAHALDRG